MEAVPLVGTSNVAAPEASDRYFEGEPGHVATFDFDYEVIVDFQKQLSWAQFIFIPPAWTGICCCVPCFINSNIDWSTRAQHVGLTVDGIRYVVDKHPTGCGLTCTDAGKVSKTVPYDKITDCDVQEPAGTACCCCIDNVLAVVNVDTASSGGEGHELSLTGLVHPQEFKVAVWNMKRSHASASPPSGGVLAAAPPQQSQMMNTALLTEIRDELRNMNATLSAQKK